VAVAGAPVLDHIGGAGGNLILHIIEREITGERGVKQIADKVVLSEVCELTKVVTL